MGFLAHANAAFHEQNPSTKPREMMCGWMPLPGYIDKIRLHLAGKLHPDYPPNFWKGYDGFWLKVSGVGERAPSYTLRWRATEPSSLSDNYCNLSIK
jgi:hypothetical protein